MSNNHMHSSIRPKVCAWRSLFVASLAAAVLFCAGQAVAASAKKGTPSKAIEPMTIEQVKKVADSTRVVLRGNIVQNLGADY